MGDLSFSEEYRREIADNTAWALLSQGEQSRKTLEAGPVAD